MSEYIDSIELNTHTSMGEQYSNTKYPYKDLNTRQNVSTTLRQIYYTSVHESVTLSCYENLCRMPLSVAYFIYFILFICYENRTY